MKNSLCSLLLRLAGSMPGVSYALLALGLICAATFPAKGANAVTLLHIFGALNDGKNSDGAEPRCGVILGKDGKFYGTTFQGGGIGGGTIYRISSSGTFTTLHSFALATGVLGNALIQGSDGNLYGSTRKGGAGSQLTMPASWTFGTVFKITTGGAFGPVLHTFAGGNNGANPSGFIQAVNGTFYGATSTGGNGWDAASATSGNGNGNGTIFTLSTGGVFKILHRFNGTDGDQPLPVVQGRDGKFYGTANLGGTGYNGTLGSGSGTIFRIDSQGVFTTLHKFNDADGSTPTFLMMDSQGNFYGTTRQGADGYGNIFKMTQAGAFSVLHKFTSESRDCLGALAEGSDGKLYGTTRIGGVNGSGTVFSVTRSGAFTTLYSFPARAPDGTNLEGAKPQCTLADGGDGYLYGTTQFGGANGTGTVFKIHYSGGASATPPSVATTAASAVVFNGAQLNGTVNPNGLAATAHFEYGLTTAYGTSTADQNVGSGTTTLPVQKTIGDLTPNTTYHYRAVATNSDGTVQGADRTFVTPDDALVGTWSERTVVRNLPAAVGSEVNIGTLTFTGGTGSIEAAVNATGTGWSVAKRYVIPIGYNAATGFPPATWLKVLPTHDTGPYGVNDFDLDVNVSGATALLRLRTVGSNGNAATARISIKTTGLQSFVTSTAAAAIAAPAQTVVANAVTELNGKAGIGVAPSGNSVIDVNGGDTRGLRLRPRSVPGAPTTGTWNKGTITLDSAANLFICTAPGTPGTWLKIGN